jgi:hypothetical protein
VTRPDPDAAEYQPDPGDQATSRLEDTILPAPRPPKPRVLQDGRDMFWSLAPLVVACMLLAGLVGMCSFRPTGPADGEPPTYDAARALQADAGAVGYPVRLPKLPEGWQANSGTRSGIEAGRTDPATGAKLSAVTSRVGYIAPSKMYVSLTQSNADETALVRSIQKSVYPTGTEEVGGVTWIVYQGGEDTEPVWTTRLQGPQGQVQLAITGAGKAEDFRALALATQTQPPLAPTR